MSSRLLIRTGTKLLELYNRQAKTRPLITMSVTTATSMAIGSYLCQKIQRKLTNNKEPTDFRQIIDYALFGGLITGPVLRYWWHALDLKIFKNKTAFLRPVKMMIVDIATFRFSIIGAFIFYVSLMQNKPLKICLQDLQEKIYPVFYESLKVWPLATLINFYLIPLQLRVLVANGVALAWNTYMAYLVNIA